jgi:hypothetical protein
MARVRREGVYGAVRGAGAWGKAPGRVGDTPPAERPAAAAATAAATAAGPAVASLSGGRSGGSSNAGGNGSGSVRFRAASVAAVCAPT